jgi:isoleucyl-tRNA synthetase
VRVAGIELEPDDVIRSERIAVDGWAVAAEGPISLALDVSLDDDLRLEGRVLDMIRTLNDKRKQSGLELTDRIRVTLPEAEADLLRHREWIADEVLAVSIRTDSGTAEPRVSKA